MPRPYDNDLRRMFLAAYAAGKGTQAELALVFGGAEKFCRQQRWSGQPERIELIPCCRASEATNKPDDNACSTIRRFSSVVQCRRRSDALFTSSTSPSIKAPPRPHRGHKLSLTPQQRHDKAARESRLPIPKDGFPDWWCGFKGTGFSAGAVRPCARGSADGVLLNDAPVEIE
jgi:hypothetical protein